MGYCHFVNVKRIQDLASAGFFCYLQPVRITYKVNSPELPDSSHSEDRLGGLFLYMPTTESITTPNIHTRAVSRRSIN